MSRLKIYAVVWTGIRSTPQDGVNMYLFDNEKGANDAAALFNTQRNILHKIIGDKFIVKEYKLYKKVVIDGDCSIPR